MVRSNLVNRRRFLERSAFMAAAFATPGLLAEELSKTPALTEGPFYPDKLPLDTDNDLLILNDQLTPAVGEITHLTGRVLDTSGNPVRNAVVEIWQVDGNGIYLHSQSGGTGTRDTNFQGFGRFLTNRKGEYYFRTVKPVAYPGRTPHIHMAVNQNGHRKLTTQLFVEGETQNERDGIYRSLKDRQKLVTSAFKPIADSKTGELEASLDLVLGVTPNEN
ncbi:dioxygenase family protein [Aeoliella mucimassa]|uniref:Protocatechuate 3,4-dioxygenase beta chain n=1 Tax=Aeoliella mucimassa TaxID=2527972 RepID=A0A518AM01_9BACT|nr:protocatechuate 3,4-dioxygenase [Aeoliella mucimassa]QDU55736.1 Protocatechuate 3,4-dioxygenase beta chain [Aeoliella mucimassa]